MPVHAYICYKCGEQFKRRHNLNDSDRNLKCPKCKTLHPHRLFCSFGTTSSATSASSNRPTGCVSPRDIPEVPGNKAGSFRDFRREGKDNSF